MASCAYSLYIKLYILRTTFTIKPSTLKTEVNKQIVLAYLQSTISMDWLIKTCVMTLLKTLHYNITLQLVNEGIQYSYTNNLPSSSMIRIVVIPGLPGLTPLGNDPAMISRVKVSFPSNVVSPIIIILNGKVRCKAGIMILRTPEEL